MTKSVLLTVSGNVPSDIRQQVAAGNRPRADYMELADELDADVLDYTGASERAGWIGTLLARLGWFNLLLAYACWASRKDYAAIVTDGEQIGLPLAALLKIFGGPRPSHIMIVHVISVRKKMAFLDYLSVQNQIDIFLVYSRHQKKFIEDRWGIDDDRVIWTPFMVDDVFFAPDKVQAFRGARPRICAVGLERRDYPTLLEAVRGLDCDVIIAAASPWSKYKDSSKARSLPQNVRRKKFSQYDLRQVYADFEFLVMPLEPVDFQAGVTAMLEAFAMGKPIVCSDVPGQRDVVVDSVNGLYAKAGDPAGLRACILRLLEAPRDCARMGASGRRLVENEMNLDRYVERLAEIVRRTIEARDASMVTARWSHTT